MQIPTFQDVLKAHSIITRHLRPTPLHRYPALDALIGTEVYVKHENYQPVGAFKVRGGVNLVSQLTPEERERGLIAASPKARARALRRQLTTCVKRLKAGRSR